MILGSFNIFSSGKRKVAKPAAKAKAAKSSNPIDALPSWGVVGPGNYKDSTPTILEVISKPGGDLKQCSSKHRTCAAVIRDSIFCKGENDVVLLISPSLYSKDTMFFLREQIQNHSDFNLVKVFKTTSTVIGGIYDNLGDFDDQSDNQFDDEDKWVPQLIKEIVTTGVLRKASDIHLTLRSQLKTQYRTFGQMVQVGDNITHSRGEQLIQGFYNTFVGNKNSQEFDKTKRISANAVVNIEIKGKKRAVKMRYEHAPGAELGDGKMALDVVLRIISDGDAVSVKPFEDLGFDYEATKLLNTVSNKAKGILLVVGATGSGKSSTLRSFYQACADNSGATKKIISVEDPPEGHVPGTNIQPLRSTDSSNEPEDVKRDGLLALASVMRQDPDVVGFGEIREPEIAKLCMEAALTGHLVGSTMHVARWIDAYSRIIEFFNIPSTVFCSTGMIQAIIAQMLVPRVCSACSLTYEEVKQRSMYGDTTDIEKFIMEECTPHAESIKYDEEYLRSLNIPKVVWDKDYSGLRFINSSPDNDCPHCMPSGIKGYALLYEIFVPSRHKEVVDLLKKHDFDTAYRRWINNKDKGSSTVDGYSIEQRAIKYAKDGLICTQNVLSVLGDV